MERIPSPKWTKRPFIAFAPPMPQTSTPPCAMCAPASTSPLSPTSIPSSTCSGLAIWQVNVGTFTHPAAAYESYVHSLIDLLKGSAIWQVKIGILHSPLQLMDSSSPYSDASDKDGQSYIPLLQLVYIHSPSSDARLVRDMIAMCQNWLLVC